MYANDDKFSLLRWMRLAQKNNNYNNNSDGNNLNNEMF